MSTTENIMINIDTIGYKKKPNKEIVGIINNRVAKNIEKLSPSDFSDRVGNQGKTFIRALIKGARNNANFIQQKLLVLDFDQEPEQISYAEFCDRCMEYNIPFAFTYKTFSYDGRSKYFKFRAVFIMDILITDSKFATAVNKLLYQLFPEGDKKCLDVARMFYGGKGIIDSNLDARVDVRNIFFYAVDQIKKKAGSNFSRDIKSFANTFNILWDSEKSELAVYRKQEIDLNMIQGEWLEQGNIVILRNEATIDDNTQKKLHNETEKIFNVIDGYTKERLIQLCPLFAEFNGSEKISNDEMFLLATNLKFINGGKKMFFEILSQNSPEYKITKWEGNWKRDIEGKNYKPMRCEERCKYANDCKCLSLYEKLSKGIKRIGKEEEFFPLNVCEQELEGCLTEVLRDAENTMNVIVAQTGLGKTEIYCRKIATMPDKKFIIAVPTCNLQDEVAERLESKGIVCHKTSSRVNNIKKLGLNDLYDEACELYNQGFGIMIRTVIKNYLAEYMDELCDYQKEGLKTILNTHESPKERCIVTTHAYLMMMNLDEFLDYEIIVDEDIIISLFKRNGVILLNCIEQMLNSYKLTKEIRHLLKKIMKMENNETCKLEPIVLDNHTKIGLYERGSVFHNELPLLLESTSIAMDRQEEQVMFFNRKNLPKRKIIIVSASANEQLYHRYFSGRKIKFYKIHEAEYQGKVIQYTASTMSRRCIEQIGADVVFSKIREIAGDVPIISFKKMDKGSIYFGKTEGFDEYCGKDIAVVGTPHSKPLFYKLLATELGYVKNKMACNLNCRRVVRNGYDFKIMSFAETEIQNLQLFLIETELEQAIGRSRVLRNSCTVYVFSSYPCKQAKLIQTGYLPHIKDEEADEDVKK